MVGLDVMNVRECEVIEVDYGANCDVRAFYKDSHWSLHVINEGMELILNMMKNWFKSVALGVCVFACMRRRGWTKEMAPKRMRCSGSRYCQLILLHQSWVHNDAKEVGVINEAKDVFETNICEVYITVCKLEAFKDNNDCLELAGHVAGWAEAFLCRV